MSAKATVLAVLLQLAGAQLERPRAYCLDTVADICIRGDEYEVEKIQPGRGYVGQAGQIVAVIGLRFPPADTHPIDCQFGTSGAQPARYVSVTEIQCPVATQSDPGSVQLTLLLDGEPFTDLSTMLYSYVETEDDGLVFQGLTLFQIIEYVSYGTSALWLVLAIGCCVGYGYRRKAVMRALASGQEEGLLSGADSQAARERRRSSSTIRSSLLDQEEKRQSTQSDNGDNPQVFGKDGSLNTAEHTCKTPKCCLFAGIASFWLAVSSLGMVIFMVYIGDNTDLSGGNPDFDTLAVDTAGSDALAITWEFHSEGECLYKMRILQ